MKKLIFRNFAIDTLNFFLIMCLTVGLIVWILQAVNYFDFVSQDGHGLKTYFSYIILNFPKIIHRIIPFIFFITLFYVLNDYEIKNELLIFWTYGITKEIRYISINKINLKKLKSIIRGIIKGCKISNCNLVGGETAEMPGTYEKGKFDIAGFAVGVVDKKKILNKEKIKKDDLILAIPSSGLHSNGYSLVRYLIDKKKINLKKNIFLKNELIKPTKIYVNEIMKLTDLNLINGCANITGGGLADNIKRVIPDNLCGQIDLKKIKTLKIFQWLKKNKISDKEMLKTFNCGIGFCLIINPKNLNKIHRFFSKEFKPYIIGKVIQGRNKIKLNGKVNWSK